MSGLSHVHIAAHVDANTRVEVELPRLAQASAGPITVPHILIVGEVQLFFRDVADLARLHAVIGEALAADGDL